MKTQSASLPNLLPELARLLYQISLPINHLFQSRSYQTSQKGSAGPLTTADLLADDFLKKELLKLLPDSGWLSEESENNPDRLQKEWVWVVDPIDGTREFVAGRPEYAISIGLVVNQKVKLGAIALPGEGRLFLGGPALPLQEWLFQKDCPPGLKNQLQKLSVQNLNRDSDMILATIQKLNSDGKLKSVLKARDPAPAIVSGDPSRPRCLVSRSEIKSGLFKKLETELELIPAGSIARKLALLAAGEADLAISLCPKHEWDICGGQALIESISDMQMLELDTGQPLLYNQASIKSYGLIAGNQTQVRYFQKILAQKKISVNKDWA